MFMYMCNGYPNIITDNKTLHMHAYIFMYSKNRSSSHLDDVILGI